MQPLYLQLFRYISSPLWPSQENEMILNTSKHNSNSNITIVYKLWNQYMKINISFCSSRLQTVVVTELWKLILSLQSHLPLITHTLRHYFLYKEDSVETFAWHEEQVVPRCSSSFHRAPHSVVQRIPYKALQCTHSQHATVTTLIWRKSM